MIDMSILSSAIYREKYRDSHEIVQHPSSLYHRSVKRLSLQFYVCTKHNYTKCAKYFFTISLML